MSVECGEWSVEFKAVFADADDMETGDFGLPFVGADDRGGPK